MRRGKGDCEGKKSRFMVGSIGVVIMVELYS